MKNMKMNRNRLSYVLANDVMEVQATALAANVTADIRLGEKTVSPFYYAPWYEEKEMAPGNSCLHVLRGNFFAFPFGLNEPKDGVAYPLHGYAGSNPYLLKSESHEGGIHKLVLSTEAEEIHAQIERKLMLRDGERNIYQQSTVTGAEGAFPVGYHPTIDIPTAQGGALIDFTKPVEAWVSPTQIEDYTKGGYSSLTADHKIEDMTKVPIVYGGTVDLTKQPFIHGFDDAWMLLCDQTVDFSWTTVSIPERGYLYYQLKDTTVLSDAMYWSSYCGRYYEPWNGRVDGCLEVGAQNGYFYFGITACEDNPLARRGFRTCTVFDGAPVDFNFIEGICEIPADYAGTKDIVRDGDGKLMILGKNGEKISVSCDVDFLKKGKI